MSHYEALGLGTSAGNDQVKKAFRKLALRWHPDKNPDDRENAEVKFKKIAQAYAVLSDSVKRRQYDAELLDDQSRRCEPTAFTATPSKHQPCVHCGGTCSPGQCPFSGTEPFATRWNTSINRSNRNSGDCSLGDGPFGRFPSSAGGSRSRRPDPRRRQADTFGFADAERIFESFFGGNPFREREPPGQQSLHLPLLATASKHRHLARPLLHALQPAL